MSLSTILGALLGVSLILGAIFMSTVTAGISPIVFWSLSGLMIVVGGTMASAFVSYEARYVILSLRNFVEIVKVQKVGRNMLNFEVGRIIRWGYVVNSKGPLALESEVAKIKREDKFIGFGVELLVTGYNGQEVREIMSNATESAFGRSVVQAEILKTMAGSAPAFGMIGTLIGLIVMLAGLSGGSSSVGEGLAVALTTTLYGVIMAHLLFKPAANKVRQREEIKRFRNIMISEGLALLADRQSPRKVQDMMNSYLDPAIHFDIDQQLRSRGAA